MIWLKSSNFLYIYIFFFLVNLRLEIMFNGVLNKKEAFLDYENVSFF